MTPMRGITILGALLGASAVAAPRPGRQVPDSERDALRAKIQGHAWSRQAYADLKGRVAPYVERHRTDPDWIVARLMLNWDTHFTIDHVVGPKWDRGEGRAPVPTPRFAGARDWAATHRLPPLEDDRSARNDQGGLVWATETKTGASGWVHPNLTGHGIESRHRAIMSLAAQAAFVAWLEGDAAHATFADAILWPFIHGLSFKEAPRFPEGDRIGGIIGLTSFEVIHEGIVDELALTIAFLADHLPARGRDLGLIQAQMKRFIDCIAAGGGREGNWNLHQAGRIAYAAITLDDDSAYADGKGRQYAVDLVLNADLPRQKGINLVVRDGYDPLTALWPECPGGYGFGVTTDILGIASLLERLGVAVPALDDDILARNLRAQQQFFHPNGYHVGLGDTINGRVHTEPLELLIAASRRHGRQQAELDFTALLKREIEAGAHRRERQSRIMPLILYVGELAEVPAAGGVLQTRAYAASTLNCFILRNPAPHPDHGLMAMLAGTRGGHMHHNGVALELYGAGIIQGADPGRGSSYWQPDHGQYYREIAAHNTVIVRGPAPPPSQRQEMTVRHAEPADQQEGVSPHLGMVEVDYPFRNPDADQRRTLVLVRTGPTRGFVVDIFRSRAAGLAEAVHDYLYHNVGQSLTLTTAADGAPLPLLAVDELGSKHGDMKGYDWFANQRGADASGDLLAVWHADLGDGQGPRTMAMRLLQAAPARIYRVDAPKNNAARTSLPPALREAPMPTIVARRRGDAWERPFIAVFEPYLERDGSALTALRQPSVVSAPSLAAVEVVGSGARTLLVHDDLPGSERQVDNLRFNGTLAVVRRTDDHVDELYLAGGTAIAWPGVATLAAEDKGDLSLRRTPDGWLLACSVPVQVAVDGSRTSRRLPAGTHPRLAIHPPPP